MLAVLMSMKPEWWEKILDGEKTLKIRNEKQPKKKFELVQEMRNLEEQFVHSN